ncbi:MAG: GNAT family N-acetyltransferase [Candidatus Nealsonbacteria bacterium]|nr:GNAT family N-acetyltransferase [Candidatus Nealsonbacteria bacterium]
MSLEAMDASCQELLKGRINLEADLPKYVLDLQGMKSSEDFLAGLSKNKRHGLRKDRRRIEKQDPKIIIDEFSDLDTLISLSKKRFHQKGEGTDWEDARRIETFRQVMGLRDKSYKARMISIYLGGQPAGVDLNVIFKDSYYALKCGYDVQRFPGIGNFMNLFEIEDAISLGMKRFDLLQNNYEWKDRLFQQVPLYKYITGHPQDSGRKELRVRQFKGGDLNRVMEIENSCFLPCDAYPQERIEQLARDHGDDFLVVEKEGSIFGYIIAYNNQGVADVDSLAVDPQYRNQGAGKMLLSFAMERFKKQGLKMASLEVRVRNSPAVALFEGSDSGRKES